MNQFISFLFCRLLLYFYFIIKGNLVEYVGPPWGIPLIIADHMLACERSGMPLACLTTMNTYAAGEAAAPSGRISALHVNLHAWASVGRKKEKKKKGKKAERCFANLCDRVFYQRGPLYYGAIGAIPFHR